MTEGKKQQPIKKGPPVDRSADATRAAVVLPPEQAAQIQEHARETYPEECCGVLIGRPGPRPAVCSAHPAENCHAERTCDRYEVEPREILRLDRVAESQGEEILGFYHSHPDHPPRPSPTDVEYAWPSYVYLIVAVTKQGHTEMKAWSYDERLHHFRECPIELCPGTAQTHTGSRRGAVANRR